MIRTFEMDKAFENLDDSTPGRVVCKTCGYVFLESWGDTIRLMEVQRHIDTHKETPDA